MAEPLPTAVPLPRSVRWFAPWTWRRQWRPREIWGIAVVILVGYPLSPGIVHYCIETTWITRHPFVSSPLLMAMRPATWLAEQWPFLKTIHTEEWFLMRDLFGSVPLTVTNDVRSPAEHIDRMSHAYEEVKRRASTP